MRVKVLFPLVASLLAACGQNDDNVFDAPVHEEKAQEQCALKGEPVNLSENNAGNISGIFVCDSTLLLKGVDPDSPFLFHTFSLKDNSSVGDYVAKGRGNQELLSPIIKGCLRKDAIYLFDLNLCAAYCFNLGRSLETQKTELSLLLNLPPQTLDSYPLGDGHLALVPQIDDYNCEILDVNGELIKKISLFPNVSGLNYFEGLSSSCEVDQDRKKLFMAMCMLPQVNILDLSTEEKTTVAISREYKDWREILNRDNSERRIYYTAATQSTKCIMALYADGSFEEWIKGTKIPHLHIFDWDGNFLYDVAIQENLKVISFDDSTQTLYGVDSKDLVYKYDLSSIL